MRVVFAKSAIYAVWLCSLSLLFMQYDGCVRAKSAVYAVSRSVSSKSAVYAV